MNFQLEKFIEYKNNRPSMSQLGQDRLVSFILNEKRNGYFVDFGAANGIGYSNSYSLEKEYEWRGILCEPNKSFHHSLLMNRSSFIDTNCVYDKTGDMVTFCETHDNYELSTIKDYLNHDHMSIYRNNYSEYEVETITLKDLLDKYRAPKVIDYLSIDTEGSELKILSAYDFSRMFKVITVEHNWTENRDKIHDMLLEYGYTRIFKEISEFDDWYVNYGILGDNGA